MFIRKMQRQNYQIIPQGDMGMYFAYMDIYIIYITYTQMFILFLF